ncbi:MAG: Uma2 family endonuclease, partial [Bacteroidota bacterium]
MERIQAIIPPEITWTEDDLFQFCQANRDLLIERDAQGQIIIMAPSGGLTSQYNAGIIARLYAWNEKYKLGYVFDSSGGFMLPNGAMRAPDAAFVSREKWENLSPEAQQKFPPVCPEFVIELRSPTDRLKVLQAKMEEWIQNGCRLAWLIDPVEKQAFVYEADGTIHQNTLEGVLNGGSVLPEFEFSLQIL